MSWPQEGRNLDLWTYAIAIPVLALVIDLLLGEPPNPRPPRGVDGQAHRRSGRTGAEGGTAPGARKERALGVLVIIALSSVFILAGILLSALITLLGGQ
jgi:cobalamin biosynthesis protein CobD/CbiB